MNPAPSPAKQEAIPVEKHTRGPWVVGPVDDTMVTHVGADGKRYEIAAVDGDYNDPDTWPVMEANARLIAAAPDLLEACTKLDAFWSEDGSTPEDHRWSKDMVTLWNSVRAAIAKATQP